MATGNDKMSRGKIGFGAVLGLLALLAVFWGFKWWPFNGDKSSQQTTITFTPPPAPPSQPVAVQPQPAPAPVAAPIPPPAAPAAPAPAPNLSDEEVDKRIAALTDGDEVKDCLRRLESWGVGISTPSSFDAEAVNCRAAVAAH
ncbi:MAG: hypothetical protein Q8R32_00770 [bacterium]|nr:hypothetical protein [bacterium]